MNINNLLEADNYDEIKERLFVRFQPIEYNRNVVKKEFLNMKIVPAVMIEKDDKKIKCSEIPYECLPKWGITKDEIINDAIRNNQIIQEPYIKSIKETLGELVPEQVSDEEFDPKIYVVTNTDKIYGASQLLNQENIDKVSEITGGDFYVLPSSRHEVLCVSCTEDRSVDELNHMVEDVNANEIEEDEYLDNQAMFYNSKDNTLEATKTHEVISLDFLKEFNKSQELDAEKLETASEMANRLRLENGYGNNKNHNKDIDVTD